MRTAFLAWSFLVATSTLLACSDDGDGDGNMNDGSTGCAAFCARSLDCPNDPAPDCVSSCQLSQGLCPAESAAAMQCAAPRPDSDFECDGEVGVTRLKEQVCAAESDALISCVVGAAF